MQAFLESTGRTPLDLLVCYGDKATDQKSYCVLSDSSCRQIVARPEKFDEIMKQSFLNNIAMAPHLIQQETHLPDIQGMSL